jgi:DedD protein
MAKAVSSEELQLRKRARRRLVGAVALVVIVVVFLPMILDNEPKPLSEDIAINIPSSPGEEDSSDSMPSEPQPLHFRPVEPASEDSDSRSQANATSDESATSASDEIKSIEPVRTEPIRTEPANAGSSKSKAADEGYVVQLGAFSDASNALRLAKMVDDARFTAYTEEVTTSGGKRTRVRVGPYPTRTAAEDASKRLKARKLTYGEPVIVRSTD